MSTTINSGWLKNAKGEKFAPRTLISQIQDSDGTSLEQKLQEMIENVADPDWNAKEGEPGHILNRTHWTEPVDPYFDNDYTGREYITIAAATDWVKISDYVPTETECIGAEIRFMLNGQPETCTASGVLDVTGEYGIPAFAVRASDFVYSDFPLVGVVKTGGTVEGVQVSAGTYYISTDIGYVSYFSVLDKAELVHKLDPKFYDRLAWTDTVNINPNFDNDLTGREVLQLDTDMYLVKISDRILTEEECIGSTITVDMGTYGIVSDTITADKLVDGTAQFGISCFLMWPEGFEGQPFIGVVRESGIVQGMEVSAGTYYLSLVENGESIYTSYFGALDGLTEEVVHKMDPKFIDAEWMATKTVIGSDITILEYAEYPDKGNGSLEVPEFELEENAEYIVKFDGITYRRTCQRFESGGFAVPGIGNIDVFASGEYEDTGEPFFIISLPGFGSVVATAVRGAHTVGIYKPGTSYKELPVEFLPRLTWDLMPGGIMTKAERTHWTDLDGTVHQLDKKYIPSEWLADRTEAMTLLMPETTCISTPGTRKYTEVDVAYSGIFDYSESGTPIEVIYDGVTYNFVATSNGIQWFGNLSVASPNGEDTGEPFCIQLNLSQNKFRLYSTDTVATEHTISIRKLSNVANPIPEEFLPESVCGVSMTAEVGQTAVVEEVDADGKPTKWKAVDFPSGGSGGAQSDWNAAEGEAGHILNRTHWVESGAVILEETTLQDENENGEFAWEGDVTLEAGRTYTIVYNGTEYTCITINGATIAVDLAGCVVFGNYGAVLGTGDTGEPFIVINYPSSGLMVADLSGASSCTIAIYGDVFHKLDPKFYERLAWEEKAIVDFPTDGAWMEMETDMYGLITNTPIVLTAGETYTVTWDGTVYELVAEEEVDEGVGVGNIDLASGGDNGIPFLVISYPDDVTLIIASDFSQGHTVAVSGPVVTIHKINPKFLPEMELPQSDWNADVGEAGYILNKPTIPTVPSRIPNPYALTFTGAVTGTYDGSSAQTIHISEGGSIGKAGTGLQSEIFNNALAAVGDYSHAEGENTIAYGRGSHAEGSESSTIGYNFVTGEANSRAYTVNHTTGLYVGYLLKYGDVVAKITTIGDQTVTLDKTLSPDAALSSANVKVCSGATGASSHSEGYGTLASGANSHAEGSETKATGNYSHAEGRYSKASGEHSHAEGNSDAYGNYSHAEGNSEAYGNYSHAEGNNTTSHGEGSHAEGAYGLALGEAAHAEGSSARAIGIASHAEGDTTNAFGKGSHAEGRGGCVSTSLTWGEGITGYKVGTTEGFFVGAKVLGQILGPDGITIRQATITGIDSDNKTITVTPALTSRYDSPIAANLLVLLDGALGDLSHAEGNQTIAAGRSQHVQGEFNILDPEYDSSDLSIRGKYAHIVGNGTDNNNRSNAHTLDWDGNAWFAGSVTADGGIIVKSSTPDSSKKFKLTVDDSGTISATEIV